MIFENIVKVANFMESLLLGIILKWKLLKNKSDLENVRNIVKIFSIKTYIYWKKIDKNWKKSIKNAIKFTECKSLWKF